MKNILLKALLLLLIISVPMTFASCGDEDEAKDTDTQAETTGAEDTVDTSLLDDDDGWSPIWKP